jgi:2-hydroxychromene-2-carboxylate isomerase
MALLTSTRRRGLVRWAREQRRRLAGAPLRVRYFHQVDDPYSALASQCLAALCERYAIELVPQLVGPPPDEAAPERERLAVFSLRDAADVAPGYGLAFPARPRAPTPEQVSLAQRILAAALGPERFVALAPRVGDALFRGDGAALDAIARAEGSADAIAVERALAAGNSERSQLGHYLGGMFWCAGEWHWGVDRLHHLERQLRAVGAARSAPSSRDTRSIAPRPDRAAAPASHGMGSRAPLALDFYLSLRSPYTYIAMERTRALAARYSIELALRPVLPMVMRGLPVPAAKRLYIVLDTKREAEDAGVDFGRICDPVGKPVLRGFSLYPFAKSRGRAFEYLLAFARAAFAEGVDTGTDAGLRHVCERAGLAWNEARAELDREGWQPELEANRAELFSLGLWGVPSFRLRGGARGEPDYATWGQDRLWRVEEEIRRRLGA